LGKLLANSTNNNSEEGSQGFTKSWIIEWTSSLGKRSHQEKDDYSLALELFNEKSKKGEVLMYEIQRSVSDGSILKKIPILNSKKAKKRREEAVKKISEQSKKGKKKIMLSDVKLRLIILASVISALIVIIFLINAFTNSSNVISHYAILHLSNADRHFYFFQMNEIFSLADKL
jgi:hypothetical protein